MKRLILVSLLAGCASTPDFNTLDNASLCAAVSTHREALPLVVSRGLLSEDEARSVGGGPRVGMGRCAVYAELGKPQAINTTETQGVRFTQWVYERYDPYCYCVRITWMVYFDGPTVSTVQRLR